MCLRLRRQSSDPSARRPCRWCLSVDGLGRHRRCSSVTKCVVDAGPWVQEDCQVFRARGDGFSPDCTAARRDGSGRQLGTCAACSIIFVCRLSTVSTYGCSNHVLSAMHWSIFKQGCNESMRHHALHVWSRRSALGRSLLRALFHFLWAHVRVVSTHRSCGRSGTSCSCGCR